MNLSFGLRSITSPPQAVTWSISLTGEKVIDKHTASHYMPLIDINTLEWSDRFSQDIVDLDKLPRMAWSDELAGEVSAQAAQQTGLKARHSSSCRGCRCASVKVSALVLLNRGT